MATTTETIESTITTGGKERVNKACELYAKAFTDDAAIRYLLPHMSEEERIAFLPSYFKPLMTASAMADGVFEEIDDYSSMTVLLPPGKHMDSYLRAIPAGLATLMLKVGPRSAYRMMVEWSNKNAAAKKKALNGAKKYWYVFFVGTDPTCQGRGLGGKLVRQAVARADADGVPAIIEATSQSSARLYEKCGFERVEVIRLGVGNAAEDGRMHAGGPGVPVVQMVYWPKTLEK